MDIAYIGFGDLAKQIRHFLQIEIPNANEVAFDDKIKNESIEIRSFSEYENEEFKHYHFYVCIGYQHLHNRFEIIKKLTRLGRKVPYFKHPSAIVDPTAKIEDGAFVYPGCILDQSTTVGAGSILHNGVIVSHDTSIGPCNYISPGTVISGDVKIGAENFFGSGTIIRNGIVIGDRCKVGLGSSVVSNLGNDCNGYGNPFRNVDHQLNLSK